MKLLEPGAELDGFTIEQCVHSGAMARVIRTFRWLLACPATLSRHGTDQGRDGRALLAAVTIPINANHF